MKSWHMLQHTIEHLTGAGYVYIGMDHFAKPDDELAIAQEKGTLQRNFQGYSTHVDCDLVSMGMSAIGHVCDNYSQNVRDLERYYELLDAGKLPLDRGIELEPDDLLRRDIITRLICDFMLDIKALEMKWHFNFHSHFADRTGRPEEDAGGWPVAAGVTMQCGCYRPAGCWCAISAWCSTATCEKAATSHAFPGSFKLRPKRVMREQMLLRSGGPALDLASHAAFHHGAQPSRYPPARSAGD